jgi:hypothetical protein
MHFSKIAIAIVGSGLVGFSNAAIVQLYADTNCRTPAGSRNVYDNTCAPLGGYQSFKITTAGGGNQYITSYSPNSCFNDATACTKANNVGACIRATNNNGGSNAMGSDAVCCGCV